MTRGLEVRDLTVPFGGSPGLSGVDLHVPAGGRLAVVGPSGAGKTTLVRALAGSADVAAGSITVDGADVTRLPADRRPIVLLSQRPLLFPHLNVFENVAFPLRVRGIRGAELRRRVGDALDVVQLRDFPSRAPASLSGGQAHRVALARAIVARPRVVLLDEPLTALDPSLREEVREAILEVHAEFGPAMVFVTHDLREAGRVADQVAILMGGRVAQIGPPATVFGRPADLAIARFLGLPNELAGALNAGGRLEVGGRPVGCGSAGRGRAFPDGAAGSRPVVVLFGFNAVRLGKEPGGLPARVLAVHHDPLGAIAEVEVLPCSSSGPVQRRPMDGGRCRVPVEGADPPAPGSLVTLELDPARLHVFDGDGRPVRS